MKLITAFITTAALAVQLQSYGDGICQGAGANADICCPGGYGTTSTQGYACAQEEANAQNLEDAILEYHDAVLCTGSCKNETGDYNECGTVYHKTHYNGHFAASLEGKEHECTEQKECGANTHKTKTCVVQHVTDHCGC